MQKYADRAIQSSRNALLNDLCEGMYEAYINNGKRLPYGHVKNRLKELKPKEKWLSRNIIHKSFMKYRDKRKKILEEAKVVPDAIRGIGTNLSALSELSNVSSKEGTGAWKVGRPVGSTKAKKEETQKNIIAAKNEIAERFASIKDAAKKRERLKQGVLVSIIKEVKEKRNVTVKISPSAIRWRIDRQSLHRHHLAIVGKYHHLQKLSLQYLELSSKWLK